MGGGLAPRTRNSVRCIAKQSPAHNTCIFNASEMPMPNGKGYGASAMGRGKGNGNSSMSQKKQKGGGKGNARSRADRQLAQGTGKATKQAFGGGKTARASLRCWDAFHPTHLPLPRSTGPYTVVRTTSFLTTAAKYIQFGAFQRAGKGEWSNIVGFHSNTESNPVNGANNVTGITVPFPGAAALSGSGMTCTPAAVSVQLINGKPLSSTDGLVFGAVCNTQLDINGRSETFNDISTEVVSYFRPRLMSAGKLALRGVHANAYPLNMSELANFKPMVNSEPVAFTLNDTIVKPVGMTPIVFINQDSPENRTPYTFLVCVEWRVRFDLGNPAVASHVQHPTSSDQTWDAAIRKAASMGHGIADIVESVANAGEAATRIGAMMA